MSENNFKYIQAGTEDQKDYNAEMKKLSTKGKRIEKLLKSPDLTDEKRENLDLEYEETVDKFLVNHKLMIAQNEFGDAIEKCDEYAAKKENKSLKYIG